MNIDDSILEVPAHHCLCGLSKSGKTSSLIMFFEQLRHSKQNYFSGKNGMIIWCCQMDLLMDGADKLVPSYQLYLDSVVKNQKHPQMILLPSKNFEDIVDEIRDMLSENFKKGLNTALVLDNLGMMTRSSSSLTSLLTYARHSKCSIFNIVHGLFYNAQLKTQRSTFFYYWLFYMTGTDVKKFFEQNFKPQELDYVYNLYENATKKRHSYLVVDMDARPAGEEKRYKNKFRVGYFIKPYTSTEMTDMIKKIEKYGKKED